MTNIAFMVGYSGAVLHNLCKTVFIPFFIAPDCQLRG